jgi:thioredoxin reductase (NADPH)
MDMSKNIQRIGAADFQTAVLESGVPVVVDFFSDECPPCEVLAPILENLAEKYAGRIRFVKLFRQENRELATSLHVTGSPTVLFFQNGKEAGKRLGGFLTKTQVRLAIEEALGDTLPQEPRGKVFCDVLIMGAGPAGLAAAIYAARAKLNTVVLDVGVGGGQAAATYRIENYPGTDGPVGGKDLTKNMREQALSFGAAIRDLEEVSEVKLTGGTKTVTTEDTDYEAKALIIATGAVPRALQADGAAEFKGRGVHYCAVCDGSMYQGREVVVIGGGDSAIEEALYLSKFASRVTVIHRSRLRAAKKISDEAYASDKIGFIPNSIVRKVNGKDYALASVVLENNQTGEMTEFATEGAFVYIGTEPASRLFEGQIELDTDGYIPAAEDTKTSAAGVFAAGDIRRKPVRQVVTAVSDGAVAGIMAEKYLRSL